MKRLHVDAPGGRYPILIGAGVLRSLASWIDAHVGPSSIRVITDANVARRHGRAIASALERTKAPVHTSVVPAGESSKSARVLERLWRELIRDGVDRRALVVALGGGVVGDLAGFVAASVLRGIPFVQVPTSLLAMVDSSVGGKTGINLPEGKNLVGAFYQPRAVFIDLDFLRTLPRREVCAGWAEIVKAGAIRDARFFSFLEKHSVELKAGRGPLMERVVATACRIKADVVSADEREGGLRMILNFGHTLGHGLEAAAGYHGLLHGEAVAIGMAFAARFGLALGCSAPEVAERVPALLRRFGLPVRLSARYAVQPGKVLASVLRDKKTGPRGPRWVFVPRVGDARIHDDVGWSGARTAIEAFLDGRTTSRAPSR